jgi:mono/diheme cytochrome c family protein
MTFYATVNLPTGDSDSFHFQVTPLSAWVTRNGMTTAGFQELMLATVNGATIGQTYTLKIQRREAGAQFDKFRVVGGAFVNGVAAPDVVPAPDLAAGAASYTAMCVGCHGNRGQGGNAIALSAGSIAQSLDDLAKFIDINMPKNAPANCIGNCARNVAAYIKNGFSTSAFNLAAGKAEYQRQCTGCHGNVGQTPVGNNLILSPPRVALRDQMVLSARIDRVMSANCHGACADNVAAYILAGYPN